MTRTRREFIESVSPQEHDRSRQNKGQNGSETLSLVRCQMSREN
jgi:hypothetical protein